MANGEVTPAPMPAFLSRSFVTSLAGNEQLMFILLQRKVEASTTLAEL
jgi:hypothetical protein